MGGIAGIFYRDNRPVAKEDLQAMLDAIRFRGPGRQGLWHDGPAGLGLCLQDASPGSANETIPYRDAESGLVITADARIDNRNELISALGMTGKYTGDAHLILRAWQKWGEHCAERLIGDFVFAIWDPRRQQLYIATDHFRIKPVCYYQDRDVFVFASQPRGLLPGRLAPNSINHSRLAAIFFNELAYRDQSSTYLHQVFYLPAASWLLVDREHCVLRQYWDASDIQPVTGKSDEEYCQAFISLLEEAVRCRLGNAEDTLVSLSGGIDSSAVAAVTSDILQTTGRRPVTLSGLSGNAAASVESDYIRKATTAMAVDPLFFSADDIGDMRDRIDEAQQHFDSPVLFQEIFLVCLCLSAGNHNIKTIMGGTQADTVMGVGIHYISHLFRQWRFAAAIKESLQYAKYGTKYPVSLLYVLGQTLLAAATPDPVRDVAYRLRCRVLHSRRLRSSHISPDFAEQPDVAAALMSIREREEYGITSSAFRMHLRAICGPVFNQMPVSLNMIASACGAEFRHPFMDKRLVEFAAGIPWSQKNRHGFEKYLLRQSMQGRVPADICWRREEDHVGWEFNRVFLSGITDRLAAIIDERENAVFEYFDHDAVQATWKKYRNTGDYACYLPLVTCYGLSRWLQTLDRR